MASPPTGLRGVLHRLTHVGVDPALPRRETKHIVLTNGYALYALLVGVVAFALSSVNALRPDVTWALAACVPLVAVTLAVNAARRPALATTLLQAGMAAIFAYIGAHEPAATEHASYFIVVGVVSFFLYDRAHRWLALVWCVVAGAAIVALGKYLAAVTPPQLPGFDERAIGTSNLIASLGVLVFFGYRSVSEVDRVEDELVEEKRKTEAILKREVAHQVAERSRELGSALAGTTGSASAPVSPTRFGSRYRVVRPLGEGGMGAVVEVERLTDGARLALKVMTGAVSRDQAARFAREAEIGARVHHENVVSIVDIGVAEGGAPFLVMELAPGGSLESQRARFGEVPWALSILRQMAAGLVALHEAGVVHRDLKPANVLLDENGRAKLSDFGIARLGAIPMGAVDPDAPTAAPERGSALTGTGAWIGTPLYMAPEAARGGREVGPAVDVFAFGLVAHELLTGRLPFATPPVLLALVGQSLPTPSPLDVPGLDARTRELVHACLLETPSARPSPRVIRDALSA